MSYRPADWTRNSLGFKGVYRNGGSDKERRGPRYRAAIQVTADGVKTVHRTKWFRSAVEAAQAYDELAVKIYGPQAPVNFPLKGEQPVELITLPSNYCHRGHEMSLTPDGDLVCHRCNADAVARYKRRRRHEVAR
jgi:hypothetical protein